MTNTSHPQPAPELDQATSSRLLKMAVSGPRRPLDDLLARLEDPDAGAWLRDAFSCRPFVDLGLDQASLEAGAVPLPRLVQLKEHSKRLVVPGADEQTRLRGLLGYFISIAAALVGHRQFISTKDPSDMRAALAELAGVVDGRLADLFGRATLPDR